MVHTDGGNVEAISEGAPERGPDHQRTDQPGAGCERDTVQVVDGASCALQEFCHERRDLLDVIAGCQFGDDASVAGVKLHLAIQGLGDKACPRVVQGETGFVAGCLYAENKHGLTGIMVALRYTESSLSMEQTRPGA